MSTSLRRVFALLLCIVWSGLFPAALAEAERPVIKHYVVLGEDYYTENASTSARADAFLVVSMDTTGNRLLFTSVLRDSKITTPKGGENKLNTVYQNHGFEGVKSTLKSHLGIEIEGTIVLNFETIKLLVDLLGGVDIEITQNEYGMIHSILLGKDPDMPKGPGMTHMTGRIALAYMRDRSSGSGDFSRTAHQRKVMTELMKKATQLSMVDMLGIFNQVRGKVVTDMGSLKLLDALQVAYSLLNPNVEILEHVVPANRTFSYKTLRGSSVLQVNWKRNRQLLDAVLYPPSTDEAGTAK